VQIQHPGRQAATPPFAQVAPSDIVTQQPGSAGHERVYAGKQTYKIARALTVEETYDLIEKFSEAAWRVQQAGFDAVELHGAHGYLIAQFMSPATNQRNDRFGGSLINRMRFPLEIIARIKEKCGDDFPILIRYSADEFVPGGRTLEESKVIARMFQDFALFSRLTVFDNLAFPLRTAKMSNLQIKQRVEETARLLHIEDFLYRHPTALSGGQQQRVALGRTLVKRPSVFLFDEPLANLDAKLRVEMRSHLKKIQQMLQTTVLHVTNDQMDAQSIADRIAIMKEGEIEQTGSPEEIYESPANIFVARFVGSPPINLAEGMIEKKDGWICLNMGEFIIPLSEVALEKRYSQLIEREIVLGVRPECINLAKGKEGMSFPAEVYFSQIQNNDLLVDLKVGDLVWRMKTHSDQTSLLAEGERVWLELVQEKLLFFDKSTQKRITV